MGYDIHITRRKNWYDEDGPEIPLSEWAAYVAGDPEMRMDGFAEAAVGSGSVLRLESDGLAVWTNYSRDGEHGGMAWFSYSQGSVRVKNPDPEIMGKMHLIAEHFGAKVQGDDCEVYGSDGRVVRDSVEESVGEKLVKPWWKLW